MSLGKKIITFIIIFLLIVLGIFVLMKRYPAKNNEYPEKTVSENNAEKQDIINPQGNNVITRFNTPDGYKRTDEEVGSFADFVRNYALYPDNSKVYLYDGNPKSVQDIHTAVFKMNLSNRDLQQCADSVMRMYAEYYWNTQQYEKIGFHFVSGFLCSYDKWREGYVVKVDGNNVEWVNSGNTDTSWEGFEKYLETVFAYAGTISMEKESEPIGIDDIRIGDIFIKGASPGHVVMIADVCVNEENGDKGFLLAQGYMPAQQFHILKNPAHDDDPWYYVSEMTWPFRTPEYTFSEGSLRRPVY